MKKSYLFAACLSAALALTACGQSQSTTSKEAATDKSKLEIVTTFYPVYEMTQQIVGDAAEVDLLIGAGTEVHDFEPSAKDIAKIQEADAFVYENENMEMWIDKVDTSKVPVIKATEGMVLLPGGEEEGHDHDHEEDGHHHAFDPHVWLSPERAMMMVESLRDQLIAEFPEEKDKFEKNAAAYIEKLTALHDKYTDTLSAAKQKAFVTQHTAFTYLAVDYGLTQLGITGVTAQEDPTPADLAKLTQFIKDHGVKYIYFEENAVKSVAETLAKETGVETDVLNPLESLTKAQQEAGEDYISIMESNLKALEKTTSQEATGTAEEATPAPAKTVYNGYFEDKDIKDRDLSDYAGEWRSVYPLLKDGALDQVFDYKAKMKKDMTADEYKAYYDTGYKSDVDSMTITDDSMTFVVNGKPETYTYKYVGYEVLTYKRGNRGVRFLFEANEEDAGRFKYVQFSDHGIAPSKAFHYHIYFGGESQAKLLEELENWPTFYPEKLSDFGIAQEMMAH